MKQRIALLVYVDLDSMPGEFHEADSARNAVGNILDGRIDHYNPIVAHAPDSMQPPNHPRNTQDSQEIPRVAVADTQEVLLDIPPVEITIIPNTAPAVITAEGNY